MGVPRFFSWITRRYPMILSDFAASPQPEIDCLYLDMNGIIYKCSKDESIIFKAQVMSKQIEEIWFSIFNYISSIVNMVKPRKLLFLGLDGVAPRAKMNNQRSRRFRSAKDYQELERKLEFYGETKNQEEFKNNCITPGTEFMNELNRQLRFFIQKKIQQDPAWRQFSVIFSGADVPGEGEHKIMSFIRQSVSEGVFNDNTSHCLYGADADLIMLALSLRLKNLCIIREQFIVKSKKVCISHSKNIKDIVFQVIYVNMIKEYMDLEYNTLREKMKVPFDIQRIIDDFVFLCFFIGNDFLPRCYCYDIREGNLEELIFGFKKFLAQCEDYIISADGINVKELHRLTKILSDFEGKFISDRSGQTRLAYKPIKPGSEAFKELEEELEEQLRESNQAVNKALIQEFESELIDRLNVNNERLKTEEQFLLQMKSLFQNNSASAKQMFYSQKLKFDPAAEPEKLNQLLRDYVQGLNYVYKYYFQNLPSWEWYYPHYYAPLVSDLERYLSYMNDGSVPMPDFSLSRPYEPFKQLLCILPRESFSLLPKCLHRLVTDIDSPLRQPINYFPDKVQVDPYGGLAEHEFINILPFIDQDHVTRVYDAIPKTAYTDVERARNYQTQNQLYVYNPGSKVLVKSFYKQIADFTVELEIHKINFENEDVRRVADVITRNITKSKNDDPDVLKFPTLYMRDFKSELRYIGKNNERKLEIKLFDTVPEDNNLKPNEIPSFKLGAEVYFGYPHEKFGMIQAVSTRKTFQCVEEFSFEEFGLDRDLTDRSKPEAIFQICKEIVDVQYSGIQLLYTDRIYLIKESKLTVRKLNGGFYSSYWEYATHIMPSNVVNKNYKYSFTKRIDTKSPSLEEELPIGQEVVVLGTSAKTSGSVGKIIGYSGGKKVKVEVTEPVSTIPPELQGTINTNECFFKLGFVADMLGMDKVVLLMMLDSIQVLLDHSKMSASGMPRTLDIGLNLIKRNERRIVPTLVRIPHDENGNFDGNIYKVFYRLELSLQAVTLIHEYKQAYPGIFQFMKMRHDTILSDSKAQNKSPDWNQDIEAADVFPHDEDPNQPLMKVYIWLLKKEEIHHPNSELNSKRVSKQKIENLLKFFRDKVPTQQTRNFVFELDPNMVISRPTVEKGLLYLKAQPEVHAVGDRVVCLSPQFFGEKAVIVGIDNQEYEVLFEKPSFGKTDLQGLVSFLWGGRFGFRELFNIQLWTKLLDFRKATDNKGWDGSIPMFHSRFRNRGIGTLAEYQKVSKIINCPFDVAEALMKNRREDPNEGYVTVVEKSQRHKVYVPKPEEKELIEAVKGDKKNFKEKVSEYAEQKNQVFKDSLQSEKPENKQPEQEEMQPVGEVPVVATLPEEPKPKKILTRSMVAEKANTQTASKEPETVAVPAQKAKVEKKQYVEKPQEQQPEKVQKQEPKPESKLEPKPAGVKSKPRYVEKKSEEPKQQVAVNVAAQTVQEPAKQVQISTPAAQVEVPKVQIVQKLDSKEQQPIVAAETAVVEIKADTKVTTNHANDVVAEVAQQPQAPADGEEAVPEEVYDDEVFG